MRSIMVKVVDDFVTYKNLPNNIGLVVRGPYEKVIQMTKELESCEMMYDLLIDGELFEMIPVVYCKRLRR
tara:strand:- start:849 stop:1058 length:210 start_codon:yes stop_codon:yes gene_type:complete